MRWRSRVHPAFIQVPGGRTPARAAEEDRYPGPVPFRVEALRGAGPAASAGEIDYRLARQAVLSEYRKGRLSRQQVCDAHPELVRAARALGSPTPRTCAVCEDAAVVLVSYVFGPRLPAHGRCITSAAELAKLDKRTDALTCYVVEVCPACSWNHLMRSFPVGRAARRQPEASR
jgi:hypothetical protein